MTEIFATRNIKSKEIFPLQIYSNVMQRLPHEYPPGRNDDKC